MGLKRMPRMHLLDQRHTLGGHALEQTMDYSLAFRQFVGIDLGRNSVSAAIRPPHTTLTERPSKRNSVRAWSLCVW